VPVLIAALTIAGCGGSSGSGSTTSFSWTVYDSRRWATCLVKAMGSTSRTDAVVRQTAGACVQLLRPKLVSHESFFEDCAARTNASDHGATDLVYSLDLERCFGH